LKRPIVLASLTAKGVNVLRDPYSNNPFVGFYTTKQVAPHRTTDLMRRAIAWR
jgi:hypothetical protein